MQTVPALLAPRKLSKTVGLVQCTTTSQRVTAVQSIFLFSTLAVLPVPCATTAQQLTQTVLTVLQAMGKHQSVPSAPPPTR